tara:strand:+ start:607 stop:1170 length:564 start_codon:yes stop_codon:yes gene_type:complete
MKQIISIITISIFISSAKPNNNLDLWIEMQQKFTINYARDFSNQSTEEWLKYFAPNKKINVYQYGKDISRENNKGKTIKIYSGSILSSLIRGRLPAKLMARTIFKRLKKQDYKKSNIELLGILKSNDKLMVYVRFDRINNKNKIYQSARSLYTLVKINQDWYIIEMSTYDDIEEVNNLVNYDAMWKF